MGRQIQIYVPITGPPCCEGYTLGEKGPTLLSNNPITTQYLKTFFDNGQELQEQTS